MDKWVKGALRFACHSAPASAKRSNVVAMMVGSPVVCVPSGGSADGQLGGPGRQDRWLRWMWLKSWWSWTGNWRAGTAPT